MRQDVHQQSKNFSNTANYCKTKQANQTNRGRFERQT